MGHRRYPGDGPEPPKGSTPPNHSIVFWKVANSDRSSLKANSSRDCLTIRKYAGQRRSNSI